MQNYLFVHFRETTSPEGEQVHFAVSRDGFHWQALTGTKKRANFTFLPPI